MSREPSSPPDTESSKPRPARRIPVGHIAIAVVVLSFAALPFFVGYQSESEAASDTGAKATTPAAKPAPAAAESMADAGPPPPLPADFEGVRVYRRVATEGGEAEPVAPPVFDCKPVRNDTSIDTDQYPVPLPPFSTGVFPCTRCHDKPEDFNTTKRTLTLEHLNIKLVHGPREQWCYGCHNPTNRDVLRLAGGRTVSFLKSYELCGQCHGPKLRDWRDGIHGRRTGCWNGKREYLLCVHCHSPHAPKFKPLKPKPRPRKPSEIKLSDD